MENKRKCSYKIHKESDAISFCENCKIFMCNKCLNHHKELFDNHQLNNIDIKNSEIFIDICKENGHEKKLEFFCKDHNELCCIACISKLKVKEYGQHKDCEVCLVEDIKDEKKNKLIQNIKYLEDLGKNLENSIKELKDIFEKINQSKEELKLNIQKVFTKLRNAINEREDELLKDVDAQYDTLFCNENIINENIEKCNSNKNEIIEFNYKETIDDFINRIKKFGYIYKKLNIDSLILKNKEHLTKFFDLIGNNLKLDNTKLLYRATRDGDTIKNFHKKFNNYKGTLMIVKTTD